MDTHGEEREMTAMIKLMGHCPVQRNFHTLGSKGVTTTAIIRVHEGFSVPLLTGTGELNTSELEAKSMFRRKKVGTLGSPSGNFLWDERSSLLSILPITGLKAGGSTLPGNPRRLWAQGDACG
jgi:hypothetical protein